MRAPSVVFGVLAVCGMSLGACSDSTSPSNPGDASTADALDATKADVAPLDVASEPTSMDAAATDVPVDSGPPPCTMTSECATRPEGHVCDTASGRCVECVAGTDTCPSSQHCDGDTNRCVAGCHADDGCAPSDAGVDAGAGGHCDLTAHTCVACLNSGHCPPGTVCMMNQCLPGCDAAHGCATGSACCEGACVETQSNLAACGGCGMTCAAANGTPVCAAGRCTIGSCMTGYADCDANLATGCEAHTVDDTAHCGMCGHACAAPANAAATCAAGACGFRCNDNFGDCDGNAANGCETDLRVTTGHCGMCGHACAYANAAASCAASTCAMGACATGYGDCDGTESNGCEVNLRTTVSSCGMCGEVCATPNATPACASGVCAVAACMTGFDDCDHDVGNGCEVNVRTDAENCGMCGRACALAHAVTGCASGACVPESCETGFGNCDANPANGCEVELAVSAQHCGACGRACTAGTLCEAGVCTPAASCNEIHTAFPLLPSGTYTIRSDAQPAYPVYCDMARDGGGWTLVLMAPSTPAGVLGYNATAWTDTSLLSADVTDPARDVAMKNRGYLSVRFTAMRLCLGGSTSCLIEPYTSDSARAVFSDDEIVGTRTVANFSVWGYAGTLGCNRIGFNVFDVGGGPARCRYGILLNNESACEGSVDGGLGFGCHGFYGTEVSAGQGDGTVATSHTRGWIWVR